MFITRSSQLLRRSLGNHVRACACAESRALIPTYSRLLCSSSHDSKNQVAQAFADVPGAKSEGEKYTMVYTCAVCDTRSAKTISKQGYHKVRCPSCRNLHLIADHLGVFEDKGWDIEKYLSQHGENVKKVVEGDVLELTREDILGKGKKLD